MTSIRSSVDDTSTISPTWHMLIWKEWCEHRYVLLALTALILIGPVCAMLTAALGWQDADVPDLLLQVSCFLYAAVAGLALGMRTSAGERSQRTLPFLMALPIAKWKVVLTKLSFGVITLVLPLITATCVVSIYAAITLRQNEEYLGGGIVSPTVVMSCWWALAIYAYTVACTARLVHEANMVGAAFLGLACVLTLHVVSKLFPNMPGVWVLELLLMASPPLFRPFDLDRILINGITGTVLALLFVVWFGTETTRGAANCLKPKSIPGTMRPPWSTPQRAMTWHAVRKLKRIGQVGGMLGVMGLAIVAWAELTAFYMMEMDYAVRSRLSIRFLWSDLLLTAGMGWAAMLIGGACLLATTTWHEDLQRGTVTFWRSRPIDSKRWFWTNYLAGFGLLTFGQIPAVGLAWCTNRLDLANVLVASLAASYTMFALTTLFMMWVDRPLYAIILAACVAGCLMSGLVTLSEALNAGRDFFRMAAFWFALPAVVVATGGALWVFQHRRNWNQ